MEWTLGDLVSSAGIDAVVRGDARIAGISYDSRAVSRGDLFCCIPGSAADGHDFAATAAAAGAAALLAERELQVALPQARVMLVREVLGSLAAAFFGRPSEAMRVAGITGTNGKTTVAYLVGSMAAAAGLREGIIGTVEARFAGRAMPSVRTTPESVDLQRLLAHMRDAGADVVAMEATSEGVHQGRVNGTKFECTAFTNLSQDHLNYHGTMEAYFRAKATIFEPEFTRRAVINTADEHGARLAREVRVPVLTFGGEGADIVATSCELRGSGTRVVLSTPAGTLDVRTPLVGRYNAENVMCAAGVAISVGLSADAIVEGARSLDGVPGRLERVDRGQPFTVLVDYAHTPDALGNALRAARELAGERRVIVVFGCGGDRDRAKRPLMGAEATSAADMTVITSDNPRSEDPLAIIAEIEAGVLGKYVIEPDRRLAIALALESASPGDVVLVAGKGHETGQTFAGETIPFDDRHVAGELLSRA